MPIAVLAAGDEFVTPDLLTAAVTAELADAKVWRLELPWPVHPFGDIAEVHEASGTEEEMIDALRGAQVCVTHLGALTERVLRTAADLKLVAVSRGGPVNVNLAAATDCGVAVCYAPGRNATAAAEYTVGMVLSALRRIPQAHTELSAGNWRGDYFRLDNCGLELNGTTVGLVGYGAIGSRVAWVLSAFGAEVLVHDPYLDAATATGVTLVDLDELLRRSRVVSLHARASTENVGMIGAEEIAMMPRGSVLVNCARGSLLDYDALCDALHSEHLFAAAIDVYDVEPPPEGSRLYRAPNLVLTPHLAGASQQVAEKAARIVAAEVGRWGRGEPLENLANPEVLER